MVAFEGISAFHLSVPCLVFQDVFVDRQAQFELMICSLSTKKLATSSGFEIHLKQDISQLATADIIIIPSWPNDLPEPPASLIHALIQAHKNGAMLVGLCLGAFVVAQTGLLAGKRATTHWAFSEVFSERFPHVEFDGTPLFIEYEDLVTSAGTVAALDCCLHLVRRFCGNEVASHIARIMVTAPFRSGGQQQYIPAPIPLRSGQATNIHKVIANVELDLGAAHNIDELAQRCAMSRRTFTRHFKLAYGTTFGRWLLNRRLSLSQELLEVDTDTISQIAEAAGFGSESVFRKHFKQAFNVSPSQWRANFCHKGEGIPTQFELYC